MENSEPSPPKGEPDESDSNWSDIDSADEEAVPEEDDGDRSLRIDLHDDEDTEISKQGFLSGSQTHKSPRRHSNVLAFIGSSKKTKL